MKLPRMPDMVREGSVGALVRRLEAENTALREALAKAERERDDKIAEGDGAIAYVADRLAAAQKRIEALAGHAK